MRNKLNNKKHQLNLRGNFLRFDLSSKKIRKPSAVKEAWAELAEITKEILEINEQLKAEPDKYEILGMFNSETTFDLLHTDADLTERSQAYNYMCNMAKQDFHSIACMLALELNGTIVKQFYFVNGKLIRSFEGV